MNSSTSFSMHLPNDVAIDYIAGFIDSPMRSGPIFKNGPSLSQCAGTSRLWGSQLGYAYCLEYGHKTKFLEYQKLSILTRSYLVLLDFTIDENPNTEDLMRAISSIHNVKVEIRKILSKLGFAKLLHDRLFETAEKNLNQLAAERRRYSTPESIAEKWAPMFVPFSICDPKNHINLSEKLAFLKDFFAVCQVFDDYCDIEDDARKEGNANLFLNGIAEEECRVIIESKEYLAPSILMYGHGVLKKYKNSNIVENAVFGHYVSYGMNWIGTRLREVNADYEALTFFEAGSWQTSLQECRDHHSNVGRARLQEIAAEIRPERLQTKDIPNGELT